MFTTLLSNLQTLISTRFLVASFFPTLAFWFGHAAMLYFLNAPFQKFVQSTIGQTSGLAVLLTASALVAIALTAYAESALLPAIQSLMEGNWSQWLVSLFSPPQVKRYERLTQEIVENHALRGAYAAGGQTLAERWRDDLRIARIYGTTHVAPNNYTMRNESAVRVTKLSRYRLRSRAISANQIQDAVSRLVIDLRANNADQRGPDDDNALEKVRELLWELVDYATDFAVAQYRLLVSIRESSYGAFPFAPTRIGNIARSVQNYAIKRYNFNFEFFWSRLQLIVQRDKEFAPLLQAAKTQLDFLISCSVLSFVWAAFWVPWLYFSSGPMWIFVAVAVAGPLAAYGWYRVAVTQYRTLADLLRSAVDLFRLDLLQQMQYGPPETVYEERELWDTVDRLHALYELYDLRFAPSKSKSS
jgi:hypothetical protein